MSKHCTGNRKIIITVLNSKLQCNLVYVPQILLHIRYWQHGAMCRDGQVFTSDLAWCAYSHQF